MTQGFLRGKTSKRKHPRVVNQTTGFKQSTIRKGLTHSRLSTHDIHPKLSPPSLATQA